MDVHEEGVRWPATLFADGVTMDAIKEHGHGATCVQGMAADWWGREAFLIQANGDDSPFEHLVNVTSLEAVHPFGSGWVVHANDVLGGTLWLAEDVMYMSGKGPDGACCCAGDVVADDGATGSIFLIGDVHCCFCCSKERGQRGCVGDDCVWFSIEGDVADSELLHAATIIVAVMVYLPTHSR